LSYCTECGKALKNDPAFCKGCGAKRKSDVAQKERIVEKRPMSKKVKVSLFVVGILVAGLTGTHMILSSIYDPSKDIQSMNNAMLSNSEEVFLEYITFEEDALLDKKQYFSYVSKMDWEDMREQLVSMTNSELEFDAFVKDQYGNDVFKVKRDSILGLYDTYEINAIPNQVFITSNIQPATINVGSKKVSVEVSEEPVEMGNAYPGIYEVKAAANNLFGDFTMTEEIEVKPSEDNQSNYHLKFEGNAYGIATNHPEAILYVNGKNTNSKLEAFEYLGPFPVNQEVTMFAEIETPDGKKVKSEPITQDQLSWGGLPFMFDDEEELNEAKTEKASLFAEEAAQYVLEFRDAYEQALNDRDYSLISSYMKPGSLAEEELIDYIGDLQDKEYSYEFTENTIVETKEIDVEVFEVTTKEKFTFTNHLNEQTTYDREKIYTIIQNGSTYKIETIDINDTERNEI
jgi:membrane-associated protein TcaA